MKGFIESLTYFLNPPPGRTSMSFVEYFYWWLFHRVEYLRTAEFSCFASIWTRIFPLCDVEQSRERVLPLIGLLCIPHDWNDRWIILGIKATGDLLKSKDYSINQQNIRIRHCRRFKRYCGLMFSIPRKRRAFLMSGCDNREYHQKLWSVNCLSVRPNEMRTFDVIAW